MITVHHLNFSRSTRILWVMEELGLEYRLVRHERTAQFRAPESLRRVHPLGKAPVIEDGALRLAESAVALDYINVRYGGGRLAPPAGSDEAWRHTEWLHYVESSAGLPIMMQLLGGMTGGLPPGLAGFVGPELDKALGYLDDAIGDGPHLLGEAFTIADIQLAYFVELLGSMGALAGRPGLSAYLARLQSRPAYVRAIEIGGPIRPPR